MWLPRWSGKIPVPRRLIASTKNARAKNANSRSRVSGQRSARGGFAGVRTAVRRHFGTADQFREEPAPRQQFLVGTGLDEPPIIEHEDPIRVRERAESMRHHDDGSVPA